MKLMQEHGPEEAAKLMAAAFLSKASFERSLCFETSSEPFALTDFHYRSRAHLLAPAGGDSVSLDKLKFIWKPYPNASSYRIAIAEVKKTGTTTSYHDIVFHDGIKENFVEYSEIAANAGTGDPPELSKPLRSGQLYGFRITVFDTQGGVISASSQDTTELALFEVK